MESQGTEVMRKRMKPDMEEKEGDGAVSDIVEKEEFQRNITASEEMELNIAHILEKIERYTQLVSELLESGKTIFKELSNEYEEHMIMIHKEQIEKWQEEIKEMRLLDASNEEANALLQNARYLLQNTHIDS
uniref:Knotted 1-binding protein 36 n=1 Tax=Fagus sylvatica TaxID=28930 RepID=A0A2N9ESW7_FAGSY